MEVARIPAPKRILYFIPIAWWGGSQRYVFDLAQAARAAGHEVLVATGEGELPERLRAAGIPVAARPVFTRGIRAASEPSFLREIARIAREFRPDIIHSHNSKGGLMGTLAGRLARVPRVLFTAHGWAFTEARPWWQRAVFWLAHYATVLLADRTICVSRSVYEHARRMPFVARKLALIPNGVAPVPLLPRSEARAALGALPAPRWIGTIAELHPNKDLGTLVRAFGRIARAHPDAALAIIGEGEERGKLEALVRELGLPGRVALAGHVPDAARYLSAFDIFVLPSRTEALGFALLEAGMAKLPSIGSAVGGIPEIILDGNTGLLFPARDDAALAACLERYLSDASRAALMGDALYAHVTTHFSKAEMLERTLALY